MTLDKKHFYEIVDNGNHTNDYPSSYTENFDEMTPERKELLRDIMKWFWEIGERDNLISTSDYEFVYDIWFNGLGFYNSDVKNRLINIRNIYVKSITDATDTPSEL